MKLWSLHLLFGALLAGSLTVQQRTADTLVEIDPGDLAPAVRRIAQSQGLTLRDNTVFFGIAPALTFDAPGCSRPVTVVLGVNFDIAPFAQALARRAGDIPRYVYIARSWEKPDRLAFFIYRMHYAVMGTFGLTRYVPGGRLLLVEAPPDCRSIETIDWSNAWNREYVNAAVVSAGKG